jgi:hypothetical protein
MFATLLHPNSFALRTGCGLLAYLTSAALAGAVSYEWGLSGNLDAALGNGLLEYADGSSQTLTTFGTSDGSTVPHIGGQAATFMRVPAFSGTGNGYNLTLSDTGPNGGGAYVNQYSVVLDVLSPSSLNWTPFFNTDPGNANDADFYIAPDGALGIGTLGYSAAGVFGSDTWHRIAFVADLGAGNVSYYVDGNPVYNRTGGSLLDGRFSLYSNQDAGPDMRLFNEGDTSGQYTHEVLVNSIFVTDSALSPAQVATLGGPNAQGVLVPEPSRFVLLALGLGALGIWRCARRQA